MRGLLLLVVLWLAPGVAAADAGEVFVGGGVLGGAAPLELGAQAVAQLGLSDLLSLRAEVGGGAYDGDAEGRGAAYLVLAWDVLKWVPELWLGGGARLSSEAAGFGAAGLGVRYFLDMDLVLLVQGGVELNSEIDVRPVASVSVLYGF